MQNWDDFIEIGAPAPFAPAPAEGLLALLGERPHAYRSMLPASDGAAPKPKPAPAPAPRKTPPAPAPSPTKAKPPVTTATSTSEARTGVANTTTRTATTTHRKSPAPKEPAPKAPAISERDEIQQMKIRASQQRIKAMQLEAKREKQADKPAVPVVSERDEITQLKIDAAQTRLEADARESQRVDGKHLDKQVPPAERLTQFQQQQKVERRVARLAEAPEPPKGLTGQALHVWNELERDSITTGNRTKAAAAQEQYWSKHDTYVDERGVVFAAQFNTTTGKLELERKDEVVTRPPSAAITATRNAQDTLAARVEKAQAKAERDFNALPGGVRRAELMDGPSSSERADALKARIEAEYYSKHPLHVGKDGVVSIAVVDPASGQVTFEEQADKLDVTRTQEIDVSGSRTRVTNARGWLSNGYDESTMTEDVDARGKVRGTTTNHKRDTRTGDIQTILDDTKVYDRAGVQTSGDRTVTINDDAAHQKTVANTKSGFDRGRLTDTRSTVDITGDGPEPGSEIDSHSATDVRYDRKGRPTWQHSTSDTQVSGFTKGEGDDPDVEWKSTEKSATTLDGLGKPIYRADGSLAVVPKMTMDRTMDTRVLGAGQDDGTDLVTVTTSHGESNAEGELVFDKYSHTTETSEGKDGSKGRTWDSPIDPTSGQLLEDPPDNWKSPDEIAAEEYNDTYGGSYGSYPPDPAQVKQARADAWQQQNADSFDDRSGWRKAKDTATTVAGVGAAVLGTALLFTGVGTGVGVALLVGSAALGTFALGSTVADYRTGRNHVGLKDVALAGAMVIPGAGGLSARLGARAFGAASKLGELSRGATALNATGRAFDTAGKAMTAGYAGYETGRVGLDVIKGNPVGTMDVLNLLAAYGGAKHAGIKVPKSARPTDIANAFRTPASSTTTSTPRVRTVDPSADVIPRQLGPSGDSTPVRGGGHLADDTNVGGVQGDGATASTPFGTRVVETVFGSRFLHNERTEPLPEISYGNKESKKFRDHAKAIAPELAGRNWNGEVRGQFRGAIDGIVGSARDGDGFVVDGTYQNGQPAIFAYRASSNQMVMLRPNGEFWSGWKLKPAQLDGVTQYGTLGTTMSAIDFGAMLRAEDTPGSLVYRSNRGHELTGLEDYPAMMGSRPSSSRSAALDAPERMAFGFRRTGPGAPELANALDYARSAPGRITVRRSSGAIEGDWKLVRDADGTEWATAQTPDGRAMRRPITRDEDFFRLNPHELVGSNLAVRRSSGRTDDDWVVSGVGEQPGTLVVSHAGAGNKTLGVDQVLLGIRGVLDASLAGRLMSGAALRQTREFNATHELGGFEPIGNGYVDGGRGMRVNELGVRAASNREVLVVDRNRDANLRQHIEVARNLRSLPDGQRAQTLARYVDEIMGGQRRDIVALNEANLGSLRNREVLIGDVPEKMSRAGVCRHRALLFKVLADEAGLHTRLHRGEARYENNSGPHVWNEVYIGGQRQIVDVMNPVGSAPDGGANFMLPDTSATARSVYHDFNGQQIYTAPATVEARN